MKIYFFIVAFISLFSLYYQSIIKRFQLLDLLDIALVLILLLALYASAFKKNIFKKEEWEKLFWGATGILIYQGLKNLYQGSIYTKFGLQELLIGFLGFLILLGPAYLALINLSKLSKTSKKKK